MKKSSPFIQSLKKGLSVLNSFLPENPSLTLSDIARINGMTYGTAHRYLNTLKKLSYITQDPEDKKYHLTPKVLNLGFAVLKSMDLRSRVFPYMLETAKDLNVTTQCAILDDIEIVYIERVRAGEIVNLDLTIGSRLPAYCTSMGKAILAFLPEEEAQSKIKKMDLKPITPYTITNKKELWKDIKLTKKRGYATNNQELTLGLMTMAVPIFKEDKKVEAALGLSFPYHRIQGNNLESVYAEKILRVSKLVSWG
jgi:IclR family pca regulon transcriptional regulator